MHKTMANVQAEAKMARDLAKETGLATHMYSSSGGSALVDLVADGVVGQIREVHHWTDRPYWPQGMYKWPEAEPIPDGFDWDLWLGPVPHKAYSHHLTHAVFRGWYEFGSGALGDTANYTLLDIFEVLKLGAPTSVQAFPSRFYEVTDTWHRQINQISFPRAATIRWEFPARGDMAPVTFVWYDGGIRPATPKLIADEGDELRTGGLLYMGDNGIISGGRRGRVYPSSLNVELNDPNRERPPSELDQFIAACKGGKPTSANFEKIYDQITMINISAIAQRFEGKKLLWDHENMQFTNEPEANKLLWREYRDGWEL
jgi:hypothetical protein